MSISIQPEITRNPLELQEDFHYIMHNLPVAVADEDIADMFAVADSDSDGRISYKEFQKMINPPKPPEGPKPTKQDFVKRFSQVIPYMANLMRNPKHDFRRRLFALRWSLCCRSPLLW